MRKGRDGGGKKRGEKNGGEKREKKKREKKEKKIRMKILATTSLPAVDRRTPTAGTPHARANKSMKNRISLWRVQ